MSRGAYRGIYCSLLDDPDFQRLSAHARHVFLTVRLCAQAGPAAIFRYYPSVIAEQTGLTASQVEHALTELAQGERPWIVREGVVLWVRNGLRHDPSMRLSDKKHRVHVRRAVEALPRLAVVLTFCDYYKITRPFDGPSMILPEKNESGPPSPESRVQSPESDLTTLVASVPSAGAESNGFPAWYDRYPRHVARRAAEIAYRAALKRGTAADILAGLERQRATFLGREKEKVPHPATWLNGDRWKDEAEEPVNPYLDWPEMADCRTCGSCHDPKAWPKECPR